MAGRAVGLEELIKQEAPRIAEQFRQAAGWAESEVALPDQGVTGEPDGTGEG